VASAHREEATMVLGEWRRVHAGMGWQMHLKKTEEGTGPRYNPE